jgi:hypothetical protein
MRHSAAPANVAWGKAKQRSQHTAHSAGRTHFDGLWLSADQCQWPVARAGAGAGAEAGAGGGGRNRGQRLSPLTSDLRAARHSERQSRRWPPPHAAHPPHTPTPTHSPSAVRIGTRTRRSAWACTHGATPTPCARTRDGPARLNGARSSEADERSRPLATACAERSKRRTVHAFKPQNRRNVLTPNKILGKKIYRFTRRAHKQIRNEVRKRANLCVLNVRDGRVGERQSGR